MVFKNVYQLHERHYRNNCVLEYWIIHDRWWSPYLWQSSNNIFLSPSFKHNTVSLLRATHIISVRVCHSYYCVPRVVGGWMTQRHLSWEEIYDVRFRSSKPWGSWLYEPTWISNPRTVTQRPFCTQNMLQQIALLLWSFPRAGRMRRRNDCSWQVFHSRVNQVYPSRCPSSWAK